jgi:DNA invertase Pin-like site-specific DNA recombinase
MEIGQLIGYARVSTQGQSLDQQRQLLKGQGCVRIFEEKISGAKKDRPELARLLDYLREGDVLVVTHLDRLARSMSDLLKIAEQCGNWARAYAPKANLGPTRRQRPGAWS